MSVPAGRRSLILILLVIGVALDLMIGLVLIYLNHQAQQAASNAHIAKVAAYEYCVASNMAKRSDLARWNEVLVLIDTMPSNPALQHFIAGVRAANGKADIQLDCAKLSP